jgi:prepilin-type N-terminal cleavage/methylation domain-containing protein
MGLYQSNWPSRHPEYGLHLTEMTRMGTKKAEPQGGFSLIELLVAITIFTFAVLGLAMGTVAVTRTNQNSHLNGVAVNVAQTKLEELRSMTSTAFSALSCPSYSTAGCSDTATSSGATFGRNWMITADSPVTGVAKIDVQVGWYDFTSHILTFTASVPTQ